MEYYPAIKRNEIVSFAETWVDLEIVIQSEVNQKEKNKYSKSMHVCGTAGSIPGLGRFPGEGKGYPLQYSGLENSMDYIVHGVSKNRA